MKMPIQKLFIFIAVCLLSLQVSARYLHNTEDVFVEKPLDNIDKIAVNVSISSGDIYEALEHRAGITSQIMEDEIIQKLLNANFNVISIEEAKNDPDAVFLDMDYHIHLLDFVVYTFDMNLSIRQKLKFSGDSNATMLVKTWSDGKHGGMAQSGLGKIRTYTHELVDNFIQASGRRYN